MKQNPEFIVPAETALLPFLLDCLSHKSRNHVKGILKRGQVSVDGKICTAHAQPLRPGQRVHVLLHVPLAHEKLPFPLLYEDDDILVVDKPAGLLSISTGKEQEKTAYRLVNEYSKIQSPPGRAFIVHRLDRETSGVLLLAKNERVKQILQDNWEEAALRRGYIALVEGKVQPAQNRIVSWLKQTKTLLMYSSSRKDDGKLAITNYKVLQADENYSLLEISLETGRKNQIRVHMKDIGHPVAGDKKYGAQTDPLERLALHANVLIVKHPVTGEEMRFEAAVPGSFIKIFESL